MCERKKSTHELSLRSVIENLSFIGIAGSAIIGQQLFNDGNCMKQVTKIKRPHIAKLDEVTITRDGETAIIDYKELGISGVNLTLGEEIYQMSDLDILNRPIEIKDPCENKTASIMLSDESIAALNH